MNRKGFAISVVLYAMVILIIGIFYLLLGIVRNRYSVGDDLKEQIINGIESGGPEIKELGDIIEKNLPLTEDDDIGTKYVSGGNDIPNYVWYSGKLWRIVAINGDGSIKMVTQGNMTSLAWNVSKTDTDYSTSQIRTWLNNEFMKTLSNTSTLLVNTNWDYTTYTTYPTKRLATTNSVSNEKIGLLTIYDYYKVRYGFGDSKHNYLNNGYEWWTMSAKEDGVDIWDINRDGASACDDPNFRFGIRPSINLISSVEITEGKGTRTNPYILDGDKATATNLELLSNRISGEYINFNNVLYRIVGIEEINGKKLTKVTMADYTVNENALKDSITFGKDNSERIYSPTYGIGLYLENWYQADSTSETYSTNYIRDVYKNMIATASDYGIKWYVSTTSGNENDYTVSKTGTPISATIGLGYYGEMFTSQYGEGSSLSSPFWLMTSRSAWHSYNITEYSGAIAQMSVGSHSGVRPFFYLKDDVKITSGLGMPHNPYQLTMD